MQLCHDLCHAAGAAVHGASLMPGHLALWSVTPMRTGVHSCSHHHRWVLGGVGPWLRIESRSGMFRKGGWKSFSSRDSGQQGAPVLEGKLADIPLPCLLIPHVPVPKAPGRPALLRSVVGREAGWVLHVSPWKHVKRTEELKGSPSIEAVSCAAPGTAGCMCLHACAGEHKPERKAGVAP